MASSTNKNRVGEINLIIDNLRFLMNTKTGFSTVVRNWKNDANSQCSQGTIPKNNHLIYQLCNKDIYQVNMFILSPLVEWLTVYRSFLEGELKFTNKTLDKFSTDGLKYLSRYAVVSEYFIETAYYATLDYNDPAKFNRASMANRQFSDLLVAISNKLLNCTDTANTLADRLYSSLRIKSKASTMNKDRIRNACYNIRLANLKIHTHK